MLFYWHITAWLVNLSEVYRIRPLPIDILDMTVEYSQYLLNLASTNTDQVVQVRVTIGHSGNDAFSQ